MNQPPDGPEKRRRIYFDLAPVPFVCCGCAAHLVTVETKTPRRSATVASEAHLGSATKLWPAAENEQPLSALGHDFLAAKVSFNVLEQFPNDESARNPQAIREVERILRL